MGTFWSGESLFQNDRYSIAAMVIQSILQHDPGFYKKLMQAYYERIESNPTYRPTRDGLLDLWSSQIPSINGIDSRAYLEALPIFNGTKLKQGYYPVIYQSESYSYGTSKTIFGSYALDGNLWWFSGNTREELPAFEIPSWVNHNLSGDGYHYVDSNGQPYQVTIRNVHGGKALEYSRILDEGYQDENKTIPNNLFTDRIGDLNSQNLPQGLYLETLEFTELAKHTSEASETFYSFGYQDFSQTGEEYSLFIGVDSKFPEWVTVQFEDLSFDLPLVNGCAILKTDRLAHDAEGILSIEVHSQEGSRLYSRALVNAGSYDGKRHQQFLIIDRDFDGLEDLYDKQVDENSIALKYLEYEKLYPDHRSYSSSTTIDDQPAEGDEEKELVSFWLSGQDLGSGWKHLDWLGYYLVTDSSNPWVYHSVLGWVYLHGHSAESVWMYTQKTGWIWTLPAVFPQGYHAKKGSWLFFEKDRYFDYALGSWVRS